MSGELINKKRIAIFAHYDKDSIIDDYVVFYLKALRKVSHRIIFVSDCQLVEVEKDKLIGIADVVISQPHGEYDFGSYKRGFLYAKEKGLFEDAHELILANDSCYGPFYPLEKVFEKMDEKSCDFWGITENKFGIKKTFFGYRKTNINHLQSYFLVLKKNIFTSDVFVDFIKTVKKEKNKSDIIFNYEIGLSKLLQQNNFKKGVLVNAAQKTFNPSICDWDELILKYNMPFLKCSVPRLQNLQYVAADNFQEVLARVSDYPVEIILKNVDRVCNNKDFLSFLPKKARMLAYKFIFFFKKIKNLVKKNLISE